MFAYISAFDSTNEIDKKKREVDLNIELGWTVLSTISISRGDYGTT